MAHSRLFSPLVSAAHYPKRLKQRHCPLRQRLSVQTSLIAAAASWFRLPGSYQHDPAFGVRKLRNKENTREIPPWPQDVSDDVVAAANATLRRFIIAARKTGQRGSDGACIELTDYNGGKVLITQDKTDVKDCIPASHELLELIAEMPKDNILLSPNSACRQWVASARGSEIRKLMKKRGHEAYRLNGLRKNATIALIQASCTANGVKAITGHITTQMIEKYGREVSKAPPKET